VHWVVSRWLSSLNLYIELYIEQSDCIIIILDIIINIAVTRLLYLNVYVKRTDLCFSVVVFVLGTEVKLFMIFEY